MHRMTRLNRLFGKGYGACEDSYRFHENKASEV